MRGSLVALPGAGVRKVESGTNALPVKLYCVVRNEIKFTRFVTVKGLANQLQLESFAAERKIARQADIVGQEIRPVQPCKELRPWPGVRSLRRFPSLFKSGVCPIVGV